MFALVCLLVIWRGITHEVIYEFSGFLEGDIWPLNETRRDCWVSKLGVKTLICIVGHWRIHRFYVWKRNSGFGVFEWRSPLKLNIFSYRIANAPRFFCTHFQISCQVSNHDTSKNISLMEIPQPSLIIPDSDNALVEVCILWMLSSYD